MKKALALLIVAILCIGMFAGCGKKDDKGSVYWLNFKPESDEVLQKVAKMYTEETGIEVKVVTAASGTYNQTLLAEMDKSDAPTLFVIGNQNAVKEWKDYASPPMFRTLSNSFSPSLSTSAKSTHQLRSPLKFNIFCQSFSVSETVKVVADGL